MTLRQSSVISQPVITPGRRQSKTPILSGNIDQKSIETVFLIAICPPLATNGNGEHCFYRFLTRIRQLWIMFSIAAYPVWLCNQSCAEYT